MSEKKALELHSERSLSTLFFYPDLPIRRYLALLFTLVCFFVSKTALQCPNSPQTHAITDFLCSLKTSKNNLKHQIPLKLRLFIHISLLNFFSFHWFVTKVPYFTKPNITLNTSLQGSKQLFDTNQNPQITKT